MNTPQASCRLGVLLLLSGISLPLFSCNLGGSSQDGVSSICAIPADQTGTISGHWPTVPIPVAIRQGEFSGTETIALGSAAESWNRFFTQSRGKAAINYGSSSGFNTTTFPNPAFGGSLPCTATGIISPSQSDGQFSGKVGIYKLSQWPQRYSATAIALTSFCYQTTTASQASPGGYPYFYQAVIEVNYQNFFVAGYKQPDLQSIILHELGHLVGLNHSCETFNKSGTPNCNDPNLDPGYIAASMFPVFSFDNSGIGQQKRYLGLNDENRANCLYSASASPTPTSTSR